MEAALLPDERTDFVFTNKLKHGWVNQKLANQSRDSTSQQPTCQPVTNLLSPESHLPVNFFTLLKEKTGPSSLDTATFHPFTVHNSRFPTGCQTIFRE